MDLFPPSVGRSSSEPCGLGARLASTVEATRGIWGDAGVNDVLKRVSADARFAFEGSTAMPRWVPERWFVEWYEGLFEGPCKREMSEISRFVAAVTDCGFGRAKRVVLSLANPWTVCRQGERLWRSEHSHGRLVVAKLEPTCARISLSDHPFVQSGLLAHGISEAFRYILTLSSAQGATMAHAVDGPVLHTTVRWS